MEECFCFRCRAVVLVDIQEGVCPNCKAYNSIISVEDDNPVYPPFECS